MFFIKTCTLKTVFFFQQLMGHESPKLHHLNFSVWCFVCPSVFHNDFSDWSRANPLKGFPENIFSFEKDFYFTESWKLDRDNELDFRLKKDSAFELKSWPHSPCLNWNSLKFILGGQAANGVVELHYFSLPNFTSFLEFNNFSLSILKLQIL